jgi:hypothetical protein
VICVGRYLGPDDETMFAPLGDYGIPAAGAERIEYQNPGPPASENAAGTCPLPVSAH